MKWKKESRTTKIYTLKEIQILSELNLLRSAFTGQVQEQLKTFNRLYFFFILLSRDWYRDNSKLLIISIYQCFFFAKHTSLSFRDNYRFQVYFFTFFCFHESVFSLFFASYVEHLVILASSFNPLSFLLLPSLVELKSFSI